MGRRVKATEKQKRAVNNIISGRFNSRAEAMREAGYAKTTSYRLTEKLLESKGVEAYIKSLDVTAQKKWGLSLPMKTMLVYLSGLDATKFYGKDGVEHPDFAVRLKFADRFAEFFGWINRSPARAGRLKKQPIFFETPEEEGRTDFNNRFKDFLRQLPENR